jgi:hypothetical protein
MNVTSEKFGEGQVINSTEVLDEEGNIVSVDIMFEHGIEQGFDVEQLDELSRKTLASYIKGAAADNAENTWEWGKKQASEPNDTSHQKSMKPIYSKNARRSDGIIRAADKLAKEETELEEGRGRPPKEGSDAWKRRQAEAQKAGAAEPEEEHKSLTDQLLNIRDMKSGGVKFRNGETVTLPKSHVAKGLLAMSKLSGPGTRPDEREHVIKQMGKSHEHFLYHIGAGPKPEDKSHPMAINKEEVEVVDELSKSTLASYVGKAHVSGLGAAAEQEKQYQYGNKKNLGKFKVAGKTGEKREAGIKLAAHKLATEGADEDIASQYPAFKSGDDGAIKSHIRKHETMISNLKNWKARGNPKHPQLDQEVARHGAHINYLKSKLSKPMEEETEMSDLTENYGDMSTAAKELVLHADNDSHLDYQSKHPIIKNLRKKMKAGKYDPSKAAKLWQYHADRAAQSYAKQYGDGSPWHKMFSTADRKQAAGHWEDMHRHELSEQLEEKKLIGKQKKLDLDGNGKLNKRDFQKLHKVKELEDEMEEVNLKPLLDAIYDGVFSEEEIAELSGKTLASYASKAADDMVSKDHSAAFDDSKTPEERKALVAGSHKRFKGLVKANGKLKEESTAIAESLRMRGVEDAVMHVLAQDRNLRNEVQEDKFKKNNPGLFNKD